MREYKREYRTCTEVPVVWLYILLQATRATAFRTRFSRRNFRLQPQIYLKRAARGVLSDFRGYFRENVPGTRVIRSRGAKSSPRIGANNRFMDFFMSGHATNGAFSLHKARFKLSSSDETKQPGGVVRNASPLFTSNRVL